MMTAERHDLSSLSESRQLCEPLGKVGLGYDRVPTIDALGLVPGELHGH
jgi:hypothetical protein